MIALQDNSPAVVSPGIYPMLYAFFDDRGVLRQDPFRRQVDAALGTQAAGVAILGLGTEVSKLTFDERVEVFGLGAVVRNRRAQNRRAATQERRRDPGPSRVDDRLGHVAQPHHRVVGAIRCVHEADRR